MNTCSGAIVSTAKPRCAPPSHGAGASTETRRTFVAEYVEMKSAIWRDVAGRGRNRSLTRSRASRSAMIARASACVTCAAASAAR